MSAEKRDQYREQLGYLCFRTSERRNDTSFLREIWNFNPSDRDPHIDGASAVAATVLNDLHQYFDGDGVAQEGIRAFADERGIELGETS